MPKRKLKGVVLTTEHRGVFFGYLAKYDDVKKQAVLEQARNCVYWSAKVKGFMGLAATGPTDDCRIGPAVPRITVEKVTSIVEASDMAVSQWEKQPWL